MAYEEKMVEVSVIFVNYNATDMLIEAIRSVKEHTQHVSYELIVVDNASPDKGIQRIKDTFEEEIKVIISTQNLGFGGANNLGVAEAEGKYIFFLNPDTLLLNDVISSLYAYCESNADKRIGALGTILLSQAKQPTNSFGMFLSPCNAKKWTYSSEWRRKGINESCYRMPASSISMVARTNKLRNVLHPGAKSKTEASAST